MIQTLGLTILLEAGVIVGYAQIARKPLVPLLLTGFLANILTQYLLWAALITFPFRYLLTLFIMELLIVGIEFQLLFLIRKNHLTWNQALFLSGSMNLASFAIGWFLRL